LNPKLIEAYEQGCGKGDSSYIVRLERIPNEKSKDFLKTEISSLNCIGATSATQDET
jgi:hypothetical protein